MAVSDAQKRAADKYRRENVKQIGVRFYPDSMAEYVWARSQGNAQAYIRRLIREDMESGGREA